ncbi:arginyl-tRNA synthetase, putative [Plasmodium vivax]|uniref:arginine--tRNA ligase n=6 Tax=Plasmodium vivax TaxID=5855 RepID=A5JZZ3_PLAVS|nr:arginyl-tRNA synthetase, putative [Plasmodium vivax]KMZ78105.1 arginyl-tRNA synthetase [Plasmodium vivax India VII]KMZ84445.1 arginyl-tRNA synthetase [Plasmodium vivax Brazil I]KMZ90225.1 arginyl-tRNA synthetase [Plasmodium vivax Mauritania I]KMZ96935.1 arginyl-tRNA synthetase [Plasmodium vivax North Korean]EDL47554.1 arginyl-tRNA synthetase, putative [Plasmodium vivax]|eukprot:XP_001617281.1 arginyl-tRNA synthetase [Plasmodium vivax Sal-1]
MGKMDCLIKKIKQVFQHSIQKCFPSISEEVVVTYANAKFGHFQCNNALNIFKKYGKELNVENAQKLSQMIIENISENFFEEIKSSPQGFITVKLSKEYIEKSLLKLYKNNQIDISVDIDEVKGGNDGDYKRVLVDFSSPNIAKEMHVGHLRSTILGDSICRIFEFLKVQTIRVNHIGDWGTQFGMIINHIVSTHPNFKENMPELTNLTSLYQEAKKLYDADKEFEKSSKNYAIKLQNNDEDCLFVWKKLCESSKKEFDKIYKILDIKLEYVGESHYISMISPALQMLKDEQLLSNVGDAICYQSENFNVPLFLQKSNGGYGYDSTDVAAIHYRLKVLNSDCLIYVTDNGQLTHFETIFELAKKAKWASENTKLVHVGFGLVLNADNKKFKTRSGTNIKLINLINEGTERAKKDLLERIQLKSEEEKTYFKGIDIDQLSEELCVSAIKYFDLKQHRNTDYKFSYDNMLNVKGNTGLYIIYAYSRMCSIFRKCSVDMDELSKDELNLVSPYEVNLGLHILKFPDVFYFVLKNMLIHKLAEYTYDLTTTFTAFYENCKVLNSENEKTRLILCAIAKSLLQICLGLLGMKAIEKL